MATPFIFWGESKKNHIWKPYIRVPLLHTQLGSLPPSLSKQVVGRKGGRMGFGIPYMVFHIWFCHLLITLGFMPKDTFGLDSPQRILRRLPPRSLTE